MLVNLFPVSSEEINVGIIDTDIESLVPPTYLLDILYIVNTLIIYVYFVLVSPQIDSSFTVYIRKCVFFAIW